MWDNLEFWNIQKLCFTSGEDGPWVRKCLAFYTLSIQRYYSLLPNGSWKGKVVWEKYQNVKSQKLKWKNIFKMSHLTT